MGCKTNITLSSDGCFLTVKTNTVTYNLKKADLSVLFCENGKIYEITDRVYRVQIPFDCVDGFETYDEFYEYIKACICAPIEVEVVEVEPKKVVKSSFEMQSDIDPKQNKIILIQQDSVTCEICYFDTESLLTYSNIQELMANSVGFPTGVNYDNVTPTIRVDLCGTEAGFTGTIADALALALADADFVLPDGTVADGLIYYKVEQLYKGQTCAGQPILNQTSTVGTSTLDGGESFCKRAEYRDADCDNFADVCLDLTLPIVIPPTGGVVVELIGAACDTDPTDPTVQRVAKTETETKK